MSQRERDGDRLRVSSDRNTARIPNEAHELFIDVEFLHDRLKQRRRPLHSSRLPREFAQCVPAAILTPVPHRLLRATACFGRGADVASAILMTEPVELERQRAGDAK